MIAPAVQIAKSSRIHSVRVALSSDAVARLDALCDEALRDFGDPLRGGLRIEGAHPRVPLLRMTARFGWLAARSKRISVQLLLSGIVNGADTEYSDGTGPAFRGWTQR